MYISSTSPSPSPSLGWLTKQVGRFKNWHKRYFVLYDTSLSYYKEEMDEDEDVESSGLRAQAVIDLGDGVTIEKMDKKKEKKTKKENGFVLTVNNADGAKRYVNLS
jgi:hypothetical protein